jgi:hypothetical protein
MQRKHPIKCMQGIKYEWSEELGDWSDNEKNSWNTLIQQTKLWLVDNCNYVNLFPTSITHGLHIWSH